MTADRIAKNVDSVMFCLSKGLRAPVGSILAGRRDDIDAARLYRKRLGGGMRQAGILAAAGLLALEERGRLVEDHANARLLAERLAVIPGIEVDPQKVQTNIIIARIDNAGLTGNELSDRLKARGVLANGVGATHIRFVTHADVNRAQCQHAADVVAEMTGSNKSIAVPTHH
jgi:threonine aldolase